jgi:hypothetical protein
MASGQNKKYKNSKKDILSNIRQGQKSNTAKKIICILKPEVVVGIINKEKKKKIIFFHFMAPDNRASNSRATDER